MNVRRISQATMIEAMERVNAVYDNKIEYLYIEPEGTGFAFRIRATNKRGPGSKFSASSFTLKDGSRRRVMGACWHVHGLLFDTIIELSPGSWITTGAAGRIDVNGGNWHDYNIGSMMYPMDASQQCECVENGIYHLEGYRNWVQGPEPAQSMVGKVVYR